jgi:bacteriocin-like protein
MEQNEKNCQKPQELTKEELEQVNGGSELQDHLNKIKKAIEKRMRGY